MLEYNSAVCSCSAYWLAVYQYLTGGGGIDTLEDAEQSAFSAAAGSDDTDKFAFLKAEGFSYYCGVDLTTIPWVQLSTSAAYLRQGRVTLNGTQLTKYPERLKTFFDAAAVLDKARP